MPTTPLSGITYPSNTQTPNGATQLQSIATTLDGIIVPRFANAAARNAAITSPQKGQVSYLISEARFEVYHSAWRTFDFYRTASLSADVTRTSTTTPTTISGLDVAVKASTTYIIDYTLFLSGDSGVDARSLFTVPAGASILIFFSGTPVNATDSNNTTVQYNTNVTPTATQQGHGITTDGLGFVRIRAVVTTAGTAGTVSIQVAQFTSSLLTTTFQAGSYVTWREV